MERDGVCVIVSGGDGMPSILHWGSPMPQPAHEEAHEAGIPPGMVAHHAPISVFVEEASGFDGSPGVAGHRLDGRAWSPRFDRSEARLDDDSASYVLDDAVAGLQIVLTLALRAGGALVIDASLTNTGDTAYQLTDLAATVPLPADAVDLLTFRGRWTMEFQTRRSAIAGRTVVENRSGRTSHDTSPTLFAGTDGFGEHRGEVWGAHLAWSGNYRLVCDQLPDGRQYLQFGELLLPGEMEVEPGGHYEFPTVYLTWSDAGLTSASRRFHRLVRNDVLPRSLGARPFNLNVWEAVYFDHSLDRLTELADLAAELGVERFVLDDGWFGSRRDDTSGLGDWYVSPDMWPDGLGPLVDVVTGHGMEFGLWFEPEMVNPDSDLYRMHPEWTLTTDGYEPILGRNQLVLDFGRDEVRQNLFDQIDAILGRYDISYVKWDMNRRMIQASNADGRAGVHDHVLGLYRMLDDLRAAHPQVEWESCASGGARIDLGILGRTERVWTSDSNDALDRQLIQRGASMFIPPEVMGSHIGPPTSHTTGRTHSLGFRAATAFFGHMGVEWNVLDMTAEQREEMARIVGLYKQHRGLLHGGDVTRLDHPEPSVVAHGVLAPDRSEALVSVATVSTMAGRVATPLVVPELEGRYRVERLRLGDDDIGRDFDPPPWFEHGDVYDAAVLGTIGLPLPVMWPERAVVVHVTRVS